ncbi:MAG: hypothetical protein J6R61_00045 [Bacteroidales bacterium]|nr:hypothetical protein [Bacteroidales bacterium]
MRAKLFLLVIMVALLSSCATIQNSEPKKVVITEVVDASGEVSGGTKDFILNALTDALKRTEGYDVYTTSPIIDQTLQPQIDYILTTKITLLSKESVLLRAEIVEASTARIVSSSSVSARADIKYMREASKELTNKLISSLKSK